MNTVIDSVELRVYIRVNKFMLSPFSVRHSKSTPRYNLVLTIAFLKNDIREFYRNSDIKVQDPRLYLIDQKRYCDDSLFSPSN